jgi:hypothetical protein
VTAGLDFAPELDGKELNCIMVERFTTYGRNKTALDALNGFFNKKLNEVFLRESGIASDRPATDITSKELNRLCRTIKEFSVTVTGSRGFDSAQVCAGGVDTSEIDRETLESKKVSGMYFAGEVIDIDGKCGGYNLQWAWSSGYVAGRNAAENAKEQYDKDHKPKA